MHCYTKGDRKRSFLFALLISCLVFSVFLGQFMSTGIVTFARFEDENKLTYAAFMKIREIIKNGENIVGVDSGSWNGASEFFLRPNLPVAYIWFDLFAALSVIFPPRLMYILLYFLHMFVGLYFIQKTCIKFFGINSKNAIIAASFLGFLMCLEAWYISFYFVTALSVVILYSTFEAFYSDTIKNKIILLYCVVLGFTSGYITVSCFVVLWVFLLSVCVLFSKKEFKKILRLVIPYLGGGVIVLVYYLSIYLYIKNVVQSSTSLADSVYFKLSLEDIFSFFTSSILVTSSNIENANTFTLGIITCITLGFSIVDKAIMKLDTMKKKFVYFGFIAYCIVTIWALVDSTALSGILYSIIPVLGKMHLPSRYLMVTLPCLYISIVLLIQAIDWEKYKKGLSIIIFALSFVTITYILLKKCGVVISFINQNHFILEMMLSIAFFTSIRFSLTGKNIGRLSIIFWSVSILITGITSFYNVERVYSRTWDIQQGSIVDNSQSIQSIDHFIQTTKKDEKEVYRIVAYDSSEDVPSYLLGNYEWYDYSQYDLCNLTGYELHLCVPHDYLGKIGGWFNKFDWEYVCNVRTDYFLTDYNIINSNPDFYNSIIDWDKGVADIGNGRIMVALRSFVPSFISGDTYFVDKTESFDNGYFYSPDLKANNITSFKTNQNTYYSLGVISEKESTIVFLPYPNRFYHYYIDGKEYKAEISNLQSKLTIPGGEHTIEIKYSNMTGSFGFYFALGASLLLSIAFPLCLVNYSKLYKKNRGNQL